MKSWTTLTLLSLVVMSSLMACTPKQANIPIQTQSGYTLSFETKPDFVWLKGPVSNQPNNHLGLGAVIVHVKDVQNQPVDGIPVLFRAESSWGDEVQIWSDPVTAKDGRAHIIFEPNYAGKIKVHVGVEDVMETVTVNVELQDFGNSTAFPGNIGLSFPL